MHRPIWYTKNKKTMSLDWRDQFSCKHLDFCLPWKTAGWQPSNLQSKLLQVDAVPEEHQLALLAGQLCLHELTQRSKDQVPIPDGLVPIVFKTLLTGLGCGMRQTRLIITEMHSRPSAVNMYSYSHSTKLVAEFWRQVGVVTSNTDAVTHSKPQPCPLCSLPSTVFFKIHNDHRLIQVTLQKQQGNVNASLQGAGQTIVNSIAACAASHLGLYLCFG